MIEVRVPASSANIGSGFDCFGIALSLYNTIRVSETEKGLYIVNSNTQEFIPNGERNLIYRSVMRVFDEVGYTKKGLKISQYSNIPMTRGLGSSSACIVGGLLAGNAISGRNLDMNRIFELADELEGHPDNVSAALFGGFCISLRDEEGLFKNSIKITSQIEFLAMIPDYYMVTKKSRELLPQTVSIKDASYNIAHASSLAAAFATGNFKNLNIYCRDMLHQKYRQEIVSDMDSIFKKCMELGALGVYLSGSGPTIIAIINKGDKNIFDNIKDYFIKNNIKRKCLRLSIDNVGAVLREINDVN